jgi:hypothetical protein
MRTGFEVISRLVPPTGRVVGHRVPKVGDPVSSEARAAMQYAQFRYVTEST